MTSLAETQVVQVHRAAYALRMGQAFIWLWEGLGTKFLFSRAESEAMLVRMGPAFAANRDWMIAFTCLAETALGVCLLLGCCMRLLGWVQIAVMGMFMVIIAMGAPEWYLDPTARIMKNVPIMAAAYASTLLGPGSWRTKDSAA